MKFAKYTFLTAGIYGLMVIAPQFFLEAKNNQDFPPAITHPEYYYGFLCVTLAWQIAFLAIGREPARYRPLMLVAAVFEKFSFFVAVNALFLGGRVHALLLGLGFVDLLFGVLFVVAFFKTKDSEPKKIWL